MELISQHAKAIMEECKARARDNGLVFQDETLEYIVTNRDLINLSPKAMIPTLYNYWVNDVEVLKGRGKYKLYPSNPYETVINSRPAVSFYNDNNPDWMNIMIFYHVIAHIDFFQNNHLYSHTWNDDFVGQALADKRLIESFRSRHGRWVDYIIEFSRSIDNITGYFSLLSRQSYRGEKDPPEKIAYYFDIFLQKEKKVPSHDIFKESERFNKLLDKDKETAESAFFAEIKERYPEFQAKFQKHRENKEPHFDDIMDFIARKSPFLAKEENQWMCSVMNVIRNTALYFSPQIRTKIINEGWASYWHDKLFRIDERISGHESAYAKVNAKVTSLSRVGLNPYAIGLRMFHYIEEIANKGKMCWNFQKLRDTELRKKFDNASGKGEEAIFDVRKHFSDFTAVNTFIDQDFMDRYDLFVAGKHLNKSRGVYQYYIKSRKASDFKKMITDSLYHPPLITVNMEKTSDDRLSLVHHFEGKPLVSEFIPGTMMGIEYLWGAPVTLETHELVRKKGSKKIERKKVLYTMKNRKIEKKDLNDE